MRDKRTWSCAVAKVNEFFSKLAMKLNLVVAGLTFLHKVVARHFMQYATELLVLRGLPLFASPISVADHLTHARVGYFGRATIRLVMLTCPAHADRHFRHAVSVSVMDARPLYVPLGRAVGEIKILLQPTPPAAVGDLILSLNQHLAGATIVLEAGTIALLRLALDQRNECLRWSRDLLACAN
jgi:hypothetical protein